MAAVTSRDSIEPIACCVAWASELEGCHLEGMTMGLTSFPMNARWAGLLAAGIATFGAQAAMPTGAVPSARSSTTDQIIIKYRDDDSMSQATDAGPSFTAMGLAEAAARRHGVTLKVVRRAATRAVVAKLSGHLPEGQVERIAAEIAQVDPSVLYAEPDRIKRALGVPNDTRYSEQWHYFESIAGLNLPLAWGLGTGAGVVVAVLDTGYRPHADLAANLVAGYDFISDLAMAADGNGRDSSALDPGDWTSFNECGDGGDSTNSSWHGTHVAGTIAAVTNNNAGIAGVAYGAKVQPVRVLGKCGGYDSDIADAIVWASGGAVAGVPANTRPARVLNLSLGGSGPCGATTQAAINGARSRNSVVVVAAGNESVDAANSSPANCAGVIPVASVNRSGGLAYYSNFGDVVLVAAPGGDTSFLEGNGILSTLNTGLQGPGNDTYAYYQGTSMATPHVAGAVALMLSRNPSLLPSGVHTRLRTSVKLFPSDCEGCGAGIVDAYWASIAAVSNSVSEKEANNTRATAQVITSRNTAFNAVTGSGDVDYLKVTLPARTTLRVSLSPNVSTRDVDLVLEDAKGAVLGRSELLAGLTDRVIYRNATAAAMTVYVKSVYYSGGAGNYAMSLNW
jgi:serine protease